MMYVKSGDIIKLVKGGTNYEVISQADLVMRLRRVSDGMGRPIFKYHHPKVYKVKL